MFQWFRQGKGRLKAGASRAVQKTKSGLAKIISVTTVFTLIIWVAVFLYGSFYYAYMPQLSHVRDVYFQFSSYCDPSQGQCPFPRANITLVQGDHDQLLIRGQRYKVHLELEMPESPVNKNLGVFMVIIQFYAKDLSVTRSSSRATILRYRNPLLETLTTLVFAPFYLFDYAEQKQMIDVELFDKYYEDAYKPSAGVMIELQARRVDLYSAKLRIEAYFTGLRYLISTWPIMSAIFGIGTNCFFLTIIAGLSWYRFQPPSENTSQKITFERKVKENKSEVKKPRPSRDRKTSNRSHLEQKDLSTLGSCTSGSESESENSSTMELLNPEQPVLEMLGKHNEDCNSEKFSTSQKSSLDPGVRKRQTVPPGDKT